MSENDFPYNIEEQILGKGSFGRVQKACDKKTSQPVAIKRFYKSEEGTDEVKMLRRVRKIRDEHGHKVRGLPGLLHNFQSGNEFFIVTELLGPTLGSLIRKPGQFPPSYVQSFGSQLCRVVKYLHSYGIIHTDLKPDNICLKPRTYPRKVPTSLPDFTGGAIALDALPYKYLNDLEITVIDFGSAVVRKDDQGPLFYTITTWPYRAPEVSGKRGWSFPCDIWSIGCILYELRTNDRSTLPGFDKRRSGYIEPGHDTHYGSEFVASFRRLLARMLDPNPENRITAAEALEDPWFKMTMFDFGQLLQRDPTGPSYVPGMMTPGIIVKLSEGPLLWLLEYWGEKVFCAEALKEDVADLLREDDLSVIPVAMLPAAKAETHEQKLAVFLQNQSAGRLLKHIVDKLFTGDKFPDLYLPETMTPELIADLTKGPLYWLFEYSKRKDFDSNAIHTAMKGRLSKFQLSFVPDAIQSAGKARSSDGKLKAFFRNRSARPLLEYIVHEFLSKDDTFPDVRVPDIMTPKIMGHLIEGPLSWIFEFYEEEAFNDAKCNFEKHMKDSLWDFDLCSILEAVQSARQVGSCEEKLEVFLQHPAAGPLLELILKHNPNVGVPEKMTPKIIDDLVNKPLLWLFKYLKRDDFDAKAIKAAIENRLWTFSLSSICKDIESADTGIHVSSKRRLFRFLENRESTYLLLAVVERLSTDPGKYANLLKVCKKKNLFANILT